MTNGNSNVTSMRSSTYASFVSANNYDVNRVELWSTYCDKSTVLVRADRKDLPSNRIILEL